MIRFPHVHDHDGDRVMTYLAVKYLFLLVTAPIWVIPWAIKQWSKTQH